MVPIPSPAASAARKSGPAPIPASGSARGGASRILALDGAVVSVQVAVSVARDQEGDHREQAEKPDCIVGGVPRLGADDHVGVEDDGGAEEGGGADGVGAPDAPGREQGEAEPGDVDQRGEEVAVERDDPNRVQELGVLRVEPGSELERVGEVKGPDGGILGEATREGHVVPGGVLVVHARVEALLGGDRPVGDDQGRGGDRDRKHDPARKRRRAPLGGGLRPRARPPGAAEADRDAGPDQDPLLEQTDDPDDLGDDDEGGDREHELGEASRRATPAGHDQRSHAVGANAESGGDHREFGRAE